VNGQDLQAMTELEFQSYQLLALVTVVEALNEDVKATRIATDAKIEALEKRVSTLTKALRHAGIQT